MSQLLTKKIINTTRSTRPTTQNNFQRQWYIVDASKEPLGRLATRIANILSGKNRADYSKDVDMGGCVIVINASKTILSGEKPKFKAYFKHSGRPGSMKSTPFFKMIQKDPTFPIYNAVRGMLSKNRLRSERLNSRLRIYANSEFPSLSQNLINAN